LILLFFASLSTTNAYAVTITGTCDAQRISYAADNAVAHTNLDQWVNMPGMARTITIPGTTSTCVAINFSAEALLDLDLDAILVRATRDGVQCQAIALDEGPDDGQFNAYAFNFICTGVTPGNHTFRIQWASANDWPISVINRNMIIHHR